jgi:hypothetical protein
LVTLFVAVLVALLVAVFVAVFVAVLVLVFVAVFVAVGANTTCVWPVIVPPDTDIDVPPIAVCANIVLESILFLNVSPPNAFKSYTSNNVTGVPGVTCSIPLADEKLTSPATNDPVANAVPPPVYNPFPPVSSPLAPVS